MSDPKIKLKALFNEDSRFVNFGEILTQMHVQGFRCHSSTIIQFNSPITALCGLNGTGKSTVLQLAGTAYKTPTGRKRLYIKDFIIAGKLDTNPFTSGATVRYEYLRASPSKLHIPFHRLRRVVTVSRNLSKWTGYKRQPARNVYFAGIGLYLPRVEQRDFVLRNASKLAIKDSEPVSIENKKAICKILGYGYDEINSNTVSFKEKDRKVVTVSRSGFDYSEANMGCGEGRIQHIIRILDTLPDKSLVLLEEPETSLHPSAQHEFAKYLLDICISKRHQIILTTHSEFILHALPSDSRIYLHLSNSGIQVIPGLTASQAKSLMTGGHIKALQIFVEDIPAKLLLTEIIRRIDPNFLQTVSISPFGDEFFIGKAVAKLQETGLQVAAVRDADKNDNPSKNIFKFPGANPPEKEIFEDVRVRFSDRQKLALFILSDILKDFENNLERDGNNPALIKDVMTALSLGISNTVHYWTTMSTWLAEHMISAFITGNAIAMRWDWAEGNPLVLSYVGGLEYGLSQAEEGLYSMNFLGNQSGTVLQGNAAEVPLPDDSVNMVFTDPPYYDVVPYADLSDLCYVWLKRFLKEHHPDLFSGLLSPKSEQIVVNPYAQEDGRGEQTPVRYQELMTQAFREGRRVLRPDGIGAIVFAHKGTAAWEALLTAVIDAGFVVTASWPIDTERASRMRANKSAALGSSIHIIVRPRENQDGSVRTADVGDWRDILAELPKRIHTWLPRLAKEGIVGADAIFSCLGPALEIFSRYSRVEKASGEQVTLREYLEQVWAAVAKEALNMIFEGADATGFEEDARLTAMWLWTLSTGANGNGKKGSPDEDEVDESPSKKAKLSGFVLEYDAARKIAQGLGAHLEHLTSVVEIKGDKARLLPVAERTRHLFGKDEAEAPAAKRKKKDPQFKFDFAKEIGESEEVGGWGKKGAPKPGSTVLDRIHQSMILFAAGRTEAMKRFLVEEGAGNDARFWRLAQALSALYPASSEEKRWVDGVLARKKGLGF